MVILIVIVLLVLLSTTVFAKGSPSKMDKFNGKKATPTLEGYPIVIYPTEVGYQPPEDGYPAPIDPCVVDPFFCYGYP